MTRLQITWRKSAIGQKEEHKRTIRALGLRRLMQTVVQRDNFAMRCMVTRVRHLVDVQEIPDE